MIIDLTRLIETGMPVYPGDEETELVQSKHFHKDFYNNHQLSINMHAGTHIDGPMHLLDCNQYLNEFLIDTFIGDGCLLDVSGEPSVDYKEQYEQLVREGQIVILYTGSGERYGRPDYFTDYPVLTAAFADFLVRKRVKMVGLDTPSPDKEPYAIHKRLFLNKILIIENLANVAALLHVKTFEIIALPLYIKADSAVARVIARVKS
ncbi:cyclase family protein [Paenibacillus sp. sgz302251]|uniref:cyclase family protein n=1 Tax=Paenibacillus sp. sgz302251 TaxID=3414493 RepID=UPI003C7E320F